MGPHSFSLLADTCIFIILRIHGVDFHQTRSAPNTTMGCHKQKLKFVVLVNADGDALGGTVSRGPTQYDQQTVISESLVLHMLPAQENLNNRV
jgi:hypothetical protein